MGVIKYTLTNKYSYKLHPLYKILLKNCDVLDRAGVDKNYKIYKNPFLSITFYWNTIKPIHPYVIYGHLALCLR